MDQELIFQRQRPDPKLSLEKQNADRTYRPHDEHMEVGYEQNLLSQTLEGLEKKFLDDIMKFAKEQNDAEVQKILDIGSGVAGAAAVGDGYRGYNSDNFDSYRERSRFLGVPEIMVLNLEVHALGAVVYDTDSRYY
ncbi:hypothetical protein CRYUN_Cryun25bG0072800 [Craigia yunnanensis]